jgi:dihydroorotase
MLDLLFREARVLIDGTEHIVNVGVTGGSIVEVATSITRPARKEIPCNGMMLLPGAIDMHVHMRDPGMTHKEDLESGTLAAVLSGVTTVADMPNTRPPTLTASAFLAKVARASEVAACNVLFYMGLGRDNVNEIEAVAQHSSLAGVKVFLGATTGDLLSGDKALSQAVDRLPLMFAFHAEMESELIRARMRATPDADASRHHVLRPVEAAMAGARAVASLAGHGRRLHICHLSAAGETDLLDPAQGLTGEVSPHHLWFTHQDTARLGNLLKVNPPVRTPDDRDALRAALADGRIQAVATDHAPHTLADKSEPYSTAPSGVPGVDTLVPSTLALVRDGFLTLSRAVDALSATPARLLGLSRKGRIAEGFDADLFLWHPGDSWTPADRDILSRCGWSPFTGIRLASRPRAVWVAGRRAVGPVPASNHE